MEGTYYVAVRTVYDIYVHLQPPEIDKCSMLATKHYDVRISNEDEVISHKIYNTTNFIFEHSDYHLSFTFNISITVIDIKGQRSNSTVITKTIDIQNITTSKCMLHIQLHASSYVCSYIIISVTTHSKLCFVK